MKPRDFLDVADALSMGSTEAEWRTAVSRAYYAAFHVARQLLTHCGFDVSQVEQAHVYVWLRLANSGHPDVQHVGNDLNELRKLRNWADYDLDRYLNHRTATAQVQSAEAMIQLLETVPTLPTVQTQITEAIKIYERDVLKQPTWRP